MSPTETAARAAPDAVKQTLREQLFAEEELNVFAILDGASVPDLLDRLYEDQPEFVCLYRGELEPDMAEVAPYLVKLDPESVFTDWVLTKGWGKHWGLFALTEADLKTTRRHFRTFLMVKDSEGSQMYFRYYDPRVLRVYLPTCNAEELELVFGPLTRYVCEAEDPMVVTSLRVDSGELKVTETAAAAAQE